MKSIFVAIFVFLSIISGQLCLAEENCKVTIFDNKHKKMKLKGITEYKVKGAKIFFEDSRIEYQSNSRVIRKNDKTYLVENPNKSNSRNILELDCRCGRNKGFWAEHNNTVICETDECKRCNMNIILP